MSTELWLLTASGLLVVVQLALQSFTFKAQVGNAYTVGPRDEAIAPRGPAGRAERAFRNLLETLPVFAVAVIVIELARKGDHWTAAGAHIYFWARIAFVAAYLWGVPWVRTLIWNASMIGLAIMYWRILA
jgi:uncharacterized MAPEG superfamily protein